jgi:hypothetical protein
VAGVFLLVTGASGAGKSSVRALIERELSPLVECVELGQIVDVPAIPTTAWRQPATEAACAGPLSYSTTGDTYCCPAIPSRRVKS